MSDWILAYDGYRPEQEGLREALCALGNGYMVTRGAAPDCKADAHHYPGTYLAGGYNRLISSIAGKELENEDLVNLPNWLPLAIRIDDGRWLGPDDVEHLSYRQELHVRDGVLVCSRRFRDADGHEVRWCERRIVSMHDPHVAALAVEITPENWSGRLSVRSAIDGGVVNAGVERYRVLECRHLEIIDTEHLGRDILRMRSRTSQSRIEIAQAIRTRAYRGEDPLNPVCEHAEHDPQWLAGTLDIDANQGERIVIEKTHALYTSRDLAISEPLLEATRLVEEAGRFRELLESHSRAWHRLWDECDLEIDAEPADNIQLKLRVHVFHLLQTASPHTCELDVGAPARGWHGEAYRGHIFWDELFVFPYLNLRLPVITRSLLRYRYRRLPEARRGARALGYEGAMFPWQSGSNGREESQELHLNPRSGHWIADVSHRQRHINAAIAYNVWQYYQVTEDHEFLYFYGANILIDIARFWSSLARYDESDDRFDIVGVMGPDEYHTDYPGNGTEDHVGLTNNSYTNVMAAWCLNRAREVLELLPNERSQELCESSGLTKKDIAHWEEISRKLRVPFHDGGIISQFEGYESLEEFDWEGYRRRYGDIHRLDRILESEGDSPNRYKASKQADVLMLFYLFSADALANLFEHLGYKFDYDTIPRNVDYYLRRTSHGSTLSRVVHAWIMARSDRAAAWRHFKDALDSDLADIQGGTTREGIHLGAMAGTLDLVQRCFLGIETRADMLHLDPVLPHELERVKVLIRYRRHRLEIEANHEELRVSSRPVTADPVTVAYRGNSRQLAPGCGTSFRLVAPKPRTFEGRAQADGDGNTAS